jgi:DNA-binding GntR family transcriptional regulator
LAVPLAQCAAQHFDAPPMPPATSSTPARASRRVSAKQNIRDQVYQLLRHRMQLGEIGVEDRLLDYEIADALGVSRMPVREALLQLKSEGYLQGTSRGFVLPQFTPGDIASIFEVRLLLEPAAAASACNHATVEGIGRMSVAASDAERAHRKGDVGQYIEANTTFRTAWVDMVPNQHLAQIINRLRDHAQAVRISTLKDKEARALSLQHTKSILDAFLRRDVGAVAERLAYNLRTSAATYYTRQETLLRAGSAKHASGAAIKTARKKPGR